MRAALPLLMFGFVVTVSLGGCRGVLGLDNYTFDASASASSTLDGGVDEEGPPPEPCTVVKPDEDIVRTCVMGLACSPYEPNIPLGKCIAYDDFAQYYNPSCVHKVVTCNDVLACFGTSLGSSSFCPSGSAAVRCQGTKGIDCTPSSPIRTVIDCAVLGGTCETYASTPGGAIDSVGCKVASTCTGTTEGCSGESYYDCFGGKGFGEDCSKSGTTCKSPGVGRASCYAKGEACDTSEPPKCVGNKARSCDRGGAIDRDCTLSGLTCEEDAKGVPHCVASGCTAEDDGARCRDTCASETEVSACIGGVNHVIDCTKYGLAKCVSGKSTAFGPYAFCQ